MVGRIGLGLWLGTVAAGAPTPAAGDAEPAAEARVPPPPTVPVDPHTLRWLEDPDAPEVVAWQQARTAEALAWLDGAPVSVDELQALVAAWRVHMAQSVGISDLAGGSVLWRRTWPDPGNADEPDARLWRHHAALWVERGEHRTEVSLTGLGVDSDWPTCVEVLSDDGRSLLWGRREPPADPLDPGRQPRPCHLFRMDVETGVSAPVRVGSIVSAAFLRGAHAVVLTTRHRGRTRVEVVGDGGEGDDLWLRRRGTWAVGQLSGDDGLLVWRARGWTPRTREWRPHTWRAPEAQVRIRLPRGAYTWAGWDAGQMILRTERRGGTVQVVAVDPARARRRHWAVRFEADPVRPIRYVRWMEDRFVVVTREDGVSRLTERDATGEVLSTPLDRPFSSVWLRHPWRESVLVRGHSPQGAETWVRTPDGAYEPLLARPYGVATRFTQVLATSADGTEVPVSVVAPANLVLDGTAPVWLQAYGGFGSGVQTHVSSVETLWLSLGGVLASVHARGGDERGEDWHEQARKEHMGRTYDDVIAAGRWFVDAGWTSEGRLVVSGFSNGGLTAAVCAARAPELFGAVLAGAGVHDLLRGPAMGRWWPDEYGRPSDPDQREVLAQISPVHATPARLPPVWITTGSEDPTVSPSHSFKLKAAWHDVPGGPVLLRAWPWPSHISHLSKQKQEAARARVEVADLDRTAAEQLAFLLRALALDPAELAAPPAPESGLSPPPATSDGGAG